MGAVQDAILRRAYHGAYLLRLPSEVRRFYMRAWRLRAQLGDEFSLGGATKPRELVPLLEAAGRARTAVEIGTGTAWTTIALALDDPERTVLSIDPAERPVRDSYLGLVPQSVASRITFKTGLGEDPPPADHPPVEFLFIDANHDRESTMGAFRAWRPLLAPQATVAFHDFNDPQWPGVTEAIQQLGLKGRGSRHLFIWRNTTNA